MMRRISIYIFLFFSVFFMGVTSIRAEMRGCYYSAFWKPLFGEGVSQVAMEYNIDNLNKIDVFNYSWDGVGSIDENREFNNKGIVLLNDENANIYKDKCPPYVYIYYRTNHADELTFWSKQISYVSGEPKATIPLSLSSDDDIKKIDETFETFKRHANEFEEWSAQYLLTKDNQSYIKAENALIAASRTQESLKNLNPETFPHFGWLIFPASVKHYKVVSQKVASLLQSMKKVKDTLFEKGDLSDAQKEHLDNTMANMHHFLELMGPSIIIPDLDREGCALISKELWNEINKILDIIKIAVPILLVLLGMMDFGKAVMSNDEKALKEAQNRFVKRLIAGVVIFFLPLILNFLLNLLETPWGEGLSLCEQIMR